MIKIMEPDSPPVVLHMEPHVVLQTIRRRPEVPSLNSELMSLKLDSNINKFHEIIREDEFDFNVAREIFIQSQASPMYKFRWCCFFC